MVDESTLGDEPPAEKPKYDQPFFLALAAKGKDAWNAWRRDPVNKDVPVTFAGVDFSEEPRDEINFAGFEFGDRANFSGCKWRGVELSTAEHREPYKPRGSRTGLGPEFWPGYASFTGAAFGDASSFLGTTFGIGASFLGTTFGIGANFCGAAFGRGATFEGATFGDVTSFYGAAFDDSAHFGDAIFKGQVEFTGRSEDQWSELAHMPGMGVDALIRRKQWLELSARHGSGPDRFLTISFARARFYGKAIFTGRSFEQTANFTNARFYSPP